MTPPNSVVDLAAGSDRALEVAEAALLAGEAIVLPTDTIYGLAARAVDPAAVARLFELKGRAETKAIAVLIAEPTDLTKLGLADDQAPLHPLVVDVVARHWPGPLTVVVARHASFNADLGGDPATVGVRCPDHDFVRALARRVGPLATTSANRAGEATGVSASEAAESLLGEVGAVVDGGELDAVASTVVNLSGTRESVLREGVISAAQLW